MSGLGDAIARDGHWLIFLNVFLQQIGVPIPAEPTLVVAGGLAAHGRLSFAHIAGTALVATLIADLTWFAIGRRYGGRALAFVFRLSSAPESRRGQAERLFARWGPAAFAVAKFIPGLPMAGPVLAGGLGVEMGVFLAYDLVAMALWATMFAGLGMVFHEDVERVLHVLEGVGGWALLVGGLVAVAIVTGGWLARRRAARTAVPRSRQSTNAPPARLTTPAAARGHLSGARG